MQLPITNHIPMVHPQKAPIHRSSVHTRKTATGQAHEVIKRGIITQFFPATYTANILILEATSMVIQGVPVACHLDGTSAQINTLCVVLFFDQHDYTDAVVIAAYPNGAQGIPQPTPGRVVSSSGYQQFSGQVVGSGTTSTFTLTGGSSNIPTGALSVLYKLSFTSGSSGAYLHLAPHGVSDITLYNTVGPLPSASATVYATGLLQVDSSGRIDIKANVGSCTITFWTCGYVF
jgi:hypothetical protein